MLRSNPRFAAISALLALALAGSPTLAHAKGTRASGQARATANSGKTVVPSQLLMLKTKPAKSFAKAAATFAVNQDNASPAAADCKLPGHDRKKCMPRRRPCLNGSWIRQDSSRGCDTADADASTDSSDQSESGSQETIEDVASDTGAN